MRYQIHTPAFCLVFQVVSAVSAANAQTDPARFETTVLSILAKQCFQCHGEKMQMSGVNFAAFRDGAAAAEEPELWIKVREKISAHVMPPPPMPGLSVADAGTVNGWIDTLSPASRNASTPSPGRVTARRLNRVEFNNTIRDFLGVTVRPGEDFPVGRTCSAKLDCHVDKSGRDSLLVIELSAKVLPLAQIPLAEVAPGIDRLVHS